MSTISKRVSKHLIARQQRAARLEAFGRALDAGILESQLLGETEHSGVVWNLAAEMAARLSGNVDQDRRLIQSLLETSSQIRKRMERQLESGELDAFNLDEEDSIGEPADASGRSAGNATDHSGTFPRACIGIGTSAKLTSEPNGSGPGQDTVTTVPPQELSAQRDYVLSLVAGFALAPKVPAVAAALLLAKAIEQNEHAVNRLLSIIRSRKSIVAVQVPVRDFERHFGHLLEDGLVMPFYVSLETIAEGPSLVGRYKPLADTKPRKSFSCFSGALLKRYSDDDELRAIISKKVLTIFKPLIICDERDRPLPARLSAVADIVITGSGIDCSLIADVLAICHDIPIGRSWFLMNELNFEPRHLGIDDLAIAIRRGRSLTRIMSILATLEAENRATAEAKAEEEGEDRPGSLMKRSESRKREKYSGCFDIIQPVKETGGVETGNGNCAQGSGKPPTGKDQLFVERLAGYGDARQWALDLKTDLEAYRDKEVAWSDLSSRLLLSGPPGTGKTTFARALCNTLQVPLVATSVARWLEPSSLGEVLAAMNATFEQANRSTPCILFIDEIDNIGNRGRSDRPYDDYWSSLVNRVLELLDGAAKTEGVIVIGATNRPDKIDNAILRSGRLERHIVIPAPDTAAMVQIIAHHLGSDLDAVMNSIEVSGSVGRTNPAAAFTELRNTTADKCNARLPDTEEGVPANV
ncbi:ATP-binding protein [Hoeflea alexandrii]|uniref:ATP-binding protein n=1 Tax=Hoeflea alexandrii TaxID=288436 RepID=UPI0035D1185B